MMMIRMAIASLLAAAAALVAQGTVWGGAHLEMQVTERGATIEFDCARGTIDGAVAPDSNGHFSLAGTFTPEHAGPTREDDSPTRAATYDGTIKEDAMVLRVTLAGPNAPAPASYDLVRGRAGTVRKCR